jgi:hypothetical protein
MAGRAGVAILEPRPRLEAWLKREFEGNCVEFRVLRSARQLSELPAQWTTTVLVVDFATDPPGVLHALPPLRGPGREVVSGVVLAEALAEWEWPLRELGVTQVIPEGEAHQRVMAFCRRQLGHLPTAVEQALARFAP